MSSDAESEGAGERSVVAGRGKNSKRKRVQVESDSEDEETTETPQDVDVDPEDVDEDGNLIRRRDVDRPVFVRGPDGYVSGSITRVSLFDFMSYKSCTIRPGPSLNMIIGPNGTGKSTLSAAILLGLGFAPVFLGRGNLKPHTFVRIGQECAELEIELRGKDGKETITVFRKIGGAENDKNKSMNLFRINGEDVSRQKVIDLATDLGIVANLCNYLPQDKVASFAGMSSSTLLLETMSAAGNINLRRWHAQLIEKGKTFDELSDELEIHVGERNKEQEEVDRLKPEKEQFEARKELEQRVALAKARLSMSQYQAHKAVFADKKTELSQANKKLDQELRRQEPMSAMTEVLIDKCNKVSESLKEHVGKGRRLQDKMKECKKAIDDKDEASSSAQLSLDSLRKNAKTVRTKLADEEAKLEKLLAIPKAPPLDKDLERVEKAKQSQVKTQITAIKDALDTLDLTSRNNSTAAEKINRELTDLNKRITQAKSARHQRQSLMCAADRSAAFAIEWLERNKDKLQSEVYLPPLITAEVTDRRYAAQVEASLTMKTKSTFICLSANDLRYLNEHLVNAPMTAAGQGRDNLCRIHVALQEAGTVRMRAQMTQEEMEQSGLDGFAGDFITAPEPVTDYLNDAAGFQKKGVTLKRDNQVNENMITRLGLESYITADSATQIHASKYGGGALTETRTYKPPRFLTHRVDEQLIKDLEGRVQAEVHKRQDMEREIQEMRKRRADLETQKKELEDQLNEFGQAAATRQLAHRAFLKAQNDIRGSQERIDRFRRQLDSDADAAKLTKKLAAAANGKLQDVLKYNSLFIKDCENMDVIIRLGLQQCQANTNRDAVSDATKAAATLIEDLRETVARLKHEKEVLREVALAKGDEVQARAQKFGAREGEVMAQLSASPVSVEAAQEMLAEARAEFDANIGVDPSIVERYDKHFERLTTLIATVEDLQEKLAKARRTLDKVLGLFKPALEDLISEIDANFSTFFESLGCGGKVELDIQGDDYAKWGILIHVRFRDHEEMQVLSATRQSGGERALSTISYLMSLTSMARAPFSLVDEINQGMDKRAERAMHNTLVKIACEEEAGQCFLITPKLLTNLDYHPRMTVLNVFNGQTMGKGAPSAGNLKAGLANYRKRARV